MNPVGCITIKHPMPKYHWPSRFLFSCFCYSLLAPNAVLCSSIYLHRGELAFALLLASNASLCLLWVVLFPVYSFAQSFAQSVPLCKQRAKQRKNIRRPHRTDANHVIALTLRSSFPNSSQLKSNVRFIEYINLAWGLPGVS